MSGLNRPGYYEAYLGGSLENPINNEKMASRNKFTVGILGRNLKVLEYSNKIFSQL